MKFLRLPPKIKILEAAGAIADGRVEVLNDTNAVVTSSDGSRRYRVYLNVGKGIACSTDNGTRFRGYVGYPIISFLMIKGVLKYRDDVGRALKGIPWKKLNELYKNYARVEEHIIEHSAKPRGVGVELINEFKEENYGLLKKIRLRYVNVCESEA